jgi:hypothetical protein
MSVPVVPHTPTRAERRAAAAYEFLLCLILAIVGAVALVHWVELEGLIGPHAAAVAALGVPRPWWLRLRIALRAAYLRHLIAGAERDIGWLQDEARDIPLLIASHRTYVSELRVQLAQVEAGR